MLLPVRLVRGWLPRRLEHLARRFVWNDPRELLNPAITEKDFRTTMNAIHVGGTYKITGSNRHPGCDDLLIDNVDVTGATIVDIGASDGSTSVDLVGRLSGFKAYVIADLYLSVQAKRRGSRVFFYDAAGTCVLIAGPRLLAWPEMSAVVRALYRRALRDSERDSKPTETVLLLNPRTRALMANDPRVTHRTHDVFTVWTESPTPDVVKIANLLRRLYFSDDQIRQALIAVRDGLPEGGHLLLVDNVRQRGISPRAGLYRREGEQFVPVAHTDVVPEIDDLIVSLAA